MRRGLTVGHWMLALILFFFAAPAVAQSKSEADKLNAEVVRLYQAGKYAEAIPIARQVLSSQRKVLAEKHPDIITSLIILASLEEMAGSRARAIERLQEVIELAGFSSIPTAKDQSSVESHLKDSILWYRQVLASANTDSERSMAELPLIAALRLSGNSAEAEKEYRSALAYWGGVDNADWTSVARLKISFSSFLRAHGNLHAAEEQVAAALNLLTRRPPKDRRVLMQVNAELGQLKILMGDVEAARSHLSLAASFADERSGNALAQIELSLARISISLGDYARAEQHLADSIKFIEAEFGLDSAHLIPALRELERARASRDDPDGAKLAQLRTTAVTSRITIPKPRGLDQMIASGLLEGNAPTWMTIWHVFNKTLDGSELEGSRQVPL